MIVKGIAEGFHDASVSLVEGNEILWAKRSPFGCIGKSFSARLLLDAREPLTDQPGG